MTSLEAYMILRMECGIDPHRAMAIIDSLTANRGTLEGLTKEDLIKFSEGYCR